MDTRMGKGAVAVAASLCLLITVPALAQSDRTGSEVLTLRLGTFEGDVDASGVAFGPQTFFDALSEISDGRLQVELVPDVGDGATDAESTVVEAIASGELDGGWPSIRAFANAGIGGLTALEAPMTITSYAAMKELVSGPVAEEALKLLDGSGVVGLGLTVGTLRRPFTAEAPLLGPGDWEGITFRSYNSPVQDDVIRTLGATPVNVSFGWIDQVREGTLRGTEFDIFQYRANEFTDEAPHVAANIVLWPKIWVLAMNQQRYESLTPEQRTWVDEAARRAVQASVDASYDESAVARELCEVGVRFVDASDSDVQAFRAAVAPVIDRLAADASSGPLLAQVQELAGRHPQADRPDVPASCQEPAQPDALAGIPEVVSTLPSGTYRREITLEDVQAAGLSNASGLTGIWTMVVTDGAFEVSCRFIGDPTSDCGNAGFEGTVEVGRLLGEGDEVWIVGDAEMHAEATGCLLPASFTEPDHCYVLEPYRLLWSIDGDELTFSNPDGSEAGVAEPYVKVD